MSAASASLTATQCRCHLNEAMELLDPPPPSSLTVAGIARAYDCLLSAATTSSAFNDSCWYALQADIYRGLLLAAHLLLGMAPREQEPHHEKDAEHYRKGVDRATVVLTPDDVATLQQTQKRCKLLLLELAMMSNDGRQSFDGHVTDWHDNILPRSSFQLLRECFELDNSSPDGNKERLVSLDPDSNEDGMCNLSACDGLENQGDNTVSECKVDIVMDAANDDDDDDGADAGIECIGFDRKLLERQENDLLDIAMPIDSQYPTKRSPKKGKKRKRIDKANSTASSVTAKQGCLVLVNDEIISKKKGSHDTPPSSSNRYFVKIQKSGILCLQLAGNKRAANVQFYLGDKKCKCEPMTLGDTFHFVLKGAQRLDVDATGSRSNSLDSDFLVFQVDEETGGGLAEGFAWVTAITQVSRDSSLRREQQDKIKQEWTKNGEWEALASQRLMHRLDSN